MVAIAALSWGTVGVIAVRIEPRSALGSEAIAFLRLAVASLVLVPIAIAHGRTRRSATGRRQRSQSRTPWPLAIASVALAGNQLFYFLAIERIGVGPAALVTLGLSPVAATAMEAALQRRAPDSRTLIAIALAFVGLGLLVQTSPFGSEGIGIAYGLASAICFAVVAISRRSMATNGPNPLTATAAMTLIATLVLLPVAGPTMSGAVFDAWVIAALAYIGVAATALAYLLYFRGLATTTASAALVIVLLEPVTASILGVTIENEPVSLGRIVGAVILLTSIVLVPQAQGQEAS